MPIRCDFEIPDLSREAFGALDYRLMSLAFESHNEIGRLADEPVYQLDWSARAREAGFDVRREVGIQVSFETFLKTYRIDTAFGEGGVYELKSVSSIVPKHEAQLRNYLMLLDLEHGKIVNFRGESVESRFVNCSIKTDERRCYDLAFDKWKGGARLQSLVEAILSDWGTGLELALYQQAFAHLLSEETDAVQSLSLFRGSIPVGGQAFILSAPCEAVKVTSMAKPTTGYADHLRKLIQLAPLRSMHWINIALHQVTLTTIQPS